MLEFICNNLGLILNIIGALLLAFSFGPFPEKESAPTTGDKYIAYFNYPVLFWTGVVLLVLGFVVQLQF
jgi:uncharacterized membrane protein YidH (DUF202 family)